MQSNPVSNLIINVLNQEQYTAASTAGNINANELYMVTGAGTDAYVPGTGITISGNTISVTAGTYAAENHTHTTEDISGLAAVATSGSYNDLTNKPNIPAAYTLPTATASTLGGIKVGSNLSISSGVLSATNTTYSSATTSTAGLMSASDKSKLNGIATGANNYTLPTASNSVLGGVKVDGSTVTIHDGIISAECGNAGINWVNVPTHASAPGTAGDIAFDTNYMYICIFANTWRRIAHDTWEGGYTPYTVTGTALNGVPGDSVTGTILTLGGTGTVTGTTLTLE